MKVRVSSLPGVWHQKIVTIYRAKDEQTSEVYISSTDVDFEELSRRAKWYLDTGHYDIRDKRVLELQAFGDLKGVAWVPEEMVALVLAETIKLSKSRGEELVPPSRKLSEDHRQAIKESSTGEPTVTIDLRGETSSYASISEASRKLGVSRPTIIRAIKSKQPVQKVGLYFCKITGYLKLKNELEKMGITIK